MASKSRKGTTKRTPSRRAAPRRKRSTRPGLGATDMDDLKAKWLDRLLVAATGMGVVGGGYLLVKKLYKGTVGEIQYNKQLTQTTESGRPAFYANQLQIAFHPSGSQTMSDWFGDGTDEEKVLSILRDIPDAETYAETVRAYSTLTGGRKLNEDLKDELTSIWGNEYYDQALQILNGKPRRR